MADDKKTLRELMGSKLFGVYLQHLYSLAHTVKDNCDLVFKGTETVVKHGKTSTIRVDPRLHALIESAVTSAANISKMLHLPKDRVGDKESEVAKWRRRRTIGLLEAVDGIELQEIFNLENRNAIEHFDRMLDLLAVDPDLSRKGRRPVACYNMVVSDASLIDPFPLALRYYVTSEQTYYVLDNRVHLGRLREEAAAVAERIGQNSGQESPGGLMITLIDGRGPPVNMQKKPPM